MKLNIPERLTLVNVLPEQGSFATLKTIEALKEMLYPSEEETKKFQIKQEGKTISWNKKGAEEIDFKITEGQTEIIKTALEDLDKNKTATVAHFYLYEKFFPSKEESK